ncbi:MAG: ribonuclease P protein component [Bacilli bacterium]|nr:ribonuclease P protein component [Bacilli bacterium]
MDKLHTVKKSRDFSLIIHNSIFVKNRSYIIYNKDNGLCHYRFGISVSKKLGNAVYRNKYKRQLRFIIDKYKKNYQNGTDYIIIIRNGYIDLDFESKEKDFIYLIEKLKKQKEIFNEKK